MSQTSPFKPLLSALGLRSEEQLEDLLLLLPREDLHRFRRFIDRLIASTAPSGPVRVTREGKRFRILLADDLQLGNDGVRRIITFLDEYGASASHRGRQPTIAELAMDTEQSVATINRRLSEFREAFPEERDPYLLAQELRRALDDISLWGSVDKSLEANIGDVPVVWRTAEASSP